IILSDYNLPDYNGVEALLLAKEKMPHVPFVFITGMLNSEEEVATAVLQGASGYILKDNLKEIPNRLPGILEAAKERQEKEENNRKRARKTAILLQKVEALVKNANDFEGKAAVLSTLAEIKGQS
ncbi:MAG: response regulator transcription factor, partial [Saprospiraceae bacterium]